MPNSPWIFFGNNARLIPTGDLIAADGTTILNGKYQQGTTNIDQSLTAAGDFTVSIALNASYYLFGTCQITIPRYLGAISFTQPITITKRGFTSIIWFSTVASESNSMSTSAILVNNYPGYTDIAFVPYGYDQLNDSALSDNSFAANGGFNAGAPTIPLINIKSVRINGANIDIVFNKPSPGGTASLAYIVDWVVWKP